MMPTLELTMTLPSTRPLRVLPAMIKPALLRNRLLRKTTAPGPQPPKRTVNALSALRAVQKCHRESIYGG